MQTESLAEHLAERYDNFLFCVEQEKVVSNVITPDAHCFRVEVEEQSRGNMGTFFELTLMFCYIEDVYFDFSKVEYHTKSALFDLQSVIRFGRLELRPVGKLLTVQLRELVSFTLEMDPAEEEGDDDHPSLEECAAMELSDPISRLLVQADEVKNILRELSLGARLSPQMLELLREGRSNAGVWGTDA